MLPAATTPTVVTMLWHPRRYWPIIAARSAAYLKTESFGSALADASKAIEIDPGFVKAYYRRASANFQLSKPEKALKDFAAVHKAKPKSKDAAKKFKECEKLVNKMRFERAISVKTEDEKPLGVRSKPRSHARTCTCLRRKSGGSSPPRHAEVEVGLNRCLKVPEIWY